VWGCVLAIIAVFAAGVVAGIVWMLCMLGKEMNRL
jgi:hypothetical protein